MGIIQFFFPKSESDKFTITLQKKIPYMINVNFIVILFFNVAATARFRSNPGIYGKFAIAVYICTALFIVGLILIKARKYELASVVSSMGLLLNLTWISVLLPAESMADIYRCGFYMQGAIICIYFIALKKWQVEAVCVLSMFPPVFYGLLITIPKYGAEGRTAFGLVMAMLITFNGIIILLKRFTEGNLALAEKETLAGKNKLAELSRLLENSKGAFAIGDSLKQETGKSVSAIKSVREALGELASNARLLSNDASCSDSVNKQIVDYSLSMNKTVEDQNANLNETSAAVTEIMATIQNIGVVAESKKRTIRELADMLDSARGEVVKTREDMDRIREASGRTMAVIDTINDVSEKTGLLAMNASIEAAHAGAAGKGFSVIAQEVRKLSDETRNSVSLIAEALNQNDVVVHESAETINAFTIKINSVTEEVKNTLGAIEEILNGISEISIGTKELTDATGQMVSLAQDTQSVVKSVTSRIMEGADAVGKISAFSCTLQSMIETLVSDFVTIEGVIHRISLAGEDNSRMLASLNEEIARMGKTT